MADIAARQRQIIGSAAEWAADNLILGAGELALVRENDGKVRARVGDGAANFSAAPYLETGTSAVRYKGEVDPTAAPPAGAVAGDMYSASMDGVVAASWGPPAAGQAVVAGDFLVLDTAGAWHVQGGGVDLAGVVLEADLAAPGGAGMVGWQGGRTVAAKLADGAISVKDEGALGDGIADDFAAIIAARDKAIAAGTTLLFPEGDYAFSNALEFGFSNLHVTFAGTVTLRHTGAARAISFDGGATGGIYGVRFGWDNAPTIIGNAATTDQVYIRASHHMKMDVRLRDGLTGMRIEFSVLSHFRINLSGNEGAFPALRPVNGLIVDRRNTPEATTACRFDLIIEAVAGLGVDLVCAQHCDFWGSSEGNGNGGIRIAVDSVKNSFYSVFCEQNGTGPHWDIAGSYNIFMNCASGGTANSGLNTTTVSGTRNAFYRGLFSKVTETGYFNEWRQVQLTQRVTMNFDSIREKCYDEAFNPIPDAYPAPTKITPPLLGTWVAAPDVGGMAPPGYFIDAQGFVHLVGGCKNGTPGSVIFTLPAGFRPPANRWVPYAVVGSAGVGQLAIGPGGEIQHITGDVAGVSLDCISFYAAPGVWADPSIPAVRPVPVIPAPPAFNPATATPSQVRAMVSWIVDRVRGFTGPP